MNWITSVLPTMHSESKWPHLPADCFRSNWFDRDRFNLSLMDGCIMCLLSRKGDTVKAWRNRGVI